MDKVKVVYAEFVSLTSHTHTGYESFSSAVSMNSSYRPPHPTTIRGMLAAATGRHQKTAVAYEWECQQQVSDSQTMHYMKGSSAKYNKTKEGYTLGKPLRATKTKETSKEDKDQFLYRRGSNLALIPTGWLTTLRVYFFSDNCEETLFALRSPIWPLSIGRSEDLASLIFSDIREVTSLDPHQDYQNYGFKSSVIPRSNSKINSASYLVNNSFEPAPANIDRPISRHFVPLRACISKETGTLLLSRESYIDEQRRSYLIKL